MVGVVDGYTLIANAFAVASLGVEYVGKVGSLLLLEDALAVVAFVTRGSRLCPDLRFKIRPA